MQKDSNLWGNPLHIFTRGGMAIYPKCKQDIYRSSHFSPFFLKETMPWKQTLCKTAYSGIDWELIQSQALFKITILFTTINVYNDDHGWLNSLYVLRISFFKKQSKGSRLNSFKIVNPWMEYTLNFEHTFSQSRGFKRNILN